MAASTLGLDEAAGKTWDVVVIGAGPAGSLAAHQVAGMGARVLLVERKRFPRPKVCGTCLNGKALGVLEASGLGEAVRRLGGVELDRFEVRVAGRGVTMGLPAGRAIGRDVLDEALVEEAIGAGADFLMETTAAMEEGDEDAETVRLEGKGSVARVTARVVVVAAGLGGLERNPREGFRTRVAERARIGAGCEVERFPEGEYRPGVIHMAVGRSGYVGLVRLQTGRLNVAAAFDREFVRSSGGPAGASGAVLEEAGFAPVEELERVSWLGTVGVTRRTRPVGGRRVFLIGDAAGYVEPFTGEGMGAGLIAARAVAPLVVRGVNRWEDELAREWVRQYQRLVGRGQRLCQGITWAARVPMAARVLVGLSAGFPAVSRMVIERVNRVPRVFPGQAALCPGHTETAGTRDQRIPR